MAVQAFGGGDNNFLSHEQELWDNIPLDFVHTADIICLGHCMTKQRVLPGSMVMSRPWGGHG